MGVGRGRQDPRRPDHARPAATTAPSCRTRRSRRPARSHQASAPTSPTSAATRKSSAAARARPVRRKRPTIRRARPRSTRAKSTSSSAATCSCRPRRRARSGGFSLTAEGGPDTQNWYIDDARRAVTAPSDTYMTDRPQSNVLGRRQHLPRPSRAEVRLRLAQGRRSTRPTPTRATASSRIHIGYPEMLAKVKRDYARPERHGLHQRLRRRHLDDGPR